jgi:radical SAM superfamily enzyme YgiQ (UPF0313 family)
VAQTNPALTVELFDGELQTTKEICSSLDADLVGISCNILTYRSALEIASAAAERGCRVVLGGPHATALPFEILQNRSFVDTVVVGDGELALSELSRGTSYDAVPNLVYRRGASIVKNDEKLLDENTLPHPTYLNLPLERYFSTYVERYGQFKPFRRSLAIYSRKGCIWRDATKGGCVFCMIPHFGVRQKTPERMWEEITFLQRTHGVDFFWEVCDTFTEDSRWLRRFVDLKPRNSGFRFHIYGRSSNISRQMTEMLQELGVYEVFLGVESGDDAMLVAANKGYTADQSRRAVELLAEKNIQVVISFVLGLPGETSASLQTTVDFARELQMFGNIVETSCSVMLPLPGSTAFKRMLAQPQLSSRHMGDLLDLERLKQDWLQNFSRVSMSEVTHALRIITTCFPINNSFSQLELRSALTC